MVKAWTAALLLAALMCLTPLAPVAVLNEAPSPRYSGTADRIVLDNPAMNVGADEVVQFEAIIYDAVNNPLTGQVNWSVSNGTVDANGLFYPWSAGTVEIIAEHDGLQVHHNLTVTPGVPVSMDVLQRRYDVRLAQTLQATLLDARGNPMTATTDVLWDLDGEPLGEDQPIWIPADIGNHTLRARHHQLEVTVNVSVTAGVPHAFVFPDHMRLQAGTSMLLAPTLVDRFGYSMPLSTVPSIAWTVENGTVSADGEYFATRTGRWTVTATHQNITGSGEVLVVPGEAVASSLVLVGEHETYMAGESYELAFERRDINGYIGFVPPAIDDVHASTGGLSIDDSGRVYWNPTSTGPATLTGTDGTVVSTVSVDVVHGRPIEVVMTVHPTQPHAGDSVTVALEAVDVTGNRWTVPANITVEVGNESQTTVGAMDVRVSASDVRSWRLSGRWFDNTTGQLFDDTVAFDVAPGPLAFIQLTGEGALVPADGDLDLNPQFFDAYGNELEPMALNWSLNGEDITLEMLLNDGRWIAPSLGGHELRVNAAGVFATVRLTVVPGDAHLLMTDAPEVLVVKAGVPFDLAVSVVDIHGHSGEATAVVSDLNTSLVEVTASPTGLGFWHVTGKVEGSYTLVLEEGGATTSLPVVVEPGAPIRLLATLGSEGVAEGDVVLLNVRGVDAFGNVVNVPRANASVDCNAGEDTFVTNGTWRIDIDTGGTDRSCTVRWNGLLAQSFFDVDEVLLGGAVGSTNNAMALASVLLCLILGVLVVLLRKAAQADEEDWVDEVFDADEKAVPELDAPDDGSEAPAEKPAATIPLHERHGLTLEDVQALAAEAKRIGVMQATPTTEQGATGWYVDASEELQYWEVTDAGEWVRHRLD